MLYESRSDCRSQNAAAEEEFQYGFSKGSWQPVVGHCAVPKARFAWQTERRRAEKQPLGWRTEWRRCARPGVETDARTDKWTGAGQWLNERTVDGRSGSGMFGLVIGRN